MEKYIFIKSCMEYNIKNKKFDIFTILATRETPLSDVGTARTP